MRFVKSPSLTLLLLLAGCGSAQDRPLAPVANVDLERFMGDWYLIAHIPTFIERNAFNAMESYQLDETGRIQTMFTFNEGAFDGESRRLTPVGFPRSDSNNSIWDMQFIWPVKTDFRIIHLDADYTQTIIGRQRRDYAWIMARTPHVPESDYRRLTRVLSDAGYATDRLRRVPHRHPRSIQP